MCFRFFCWWAAINKSLLRLSDSASLSTKQTNNYCFSRKKRKLTNKNLVSLIFHPSSSLPSDIKLSKIYSFAWESITRLRRWSYKADAIYILYYIRHEYDMEIPMNKEKILKSVSPLTFRSFWIFAITHVKKVLKIWLRINYNGTIFSA